MSESPFRPALEAVLRSSLSYLDGLDAGSVSATVTLAELRTRLGRDLNREPIPAVEVIEELIRDTEGGHVGSAGGRFFAWAIGGATPASLAADWLTSVWDQNAALYASGPAAAVVEEIAGAWLKEILGLPASASFALVNGCQMAHVTCLAAARHHLLVQRNWDVEREGLAGAPRIRVITSNRHGSVDRAIRLLGIGSANIIDLSLDARHRCTPEALEEALRSGDGPAIVALQAGDLLTGSFDRYRELIPIARRHGAWVHIDGAFGLWVAASPVYRGLLDGFAEADSWATDGHKWLNTPYDCGYAFCGTPRGAPERDGPQGFLSVA